MSKQRILYHQFEGIEGLRSVSTAVNESSLEASLVEITRMRVSQINGCAYCLDLHSRRAREAGESEARLYLLSAWRETNLYSRRERAALAFAEAVTLISHNGVPSAVLANVEEEFTSQELPALLFAVVEINAWNRLAIAAKRGGP